MSEKYLIKQRTPYGFIEVEVSKEIYEFDKENKAYMERISRRERRHNYSLESALYEGEKYGYYDTYPSEESERLCEKNEESKNFSEAFRKLSEKQQRRLLMFANGDTYRVIAIKEGIDKKTAYESVQSAIKKIQKIF